ncbi:hypothetical protein LWI28_015160 [Acer negundo]|uniref:AMP-dependent synthetase/ligase domain-containing protein n=1 Tax=Acer negundo TaxID=4023 RepID=A0AAD5IF53_ACENE|nr:hypothetical protein LWI28_015160 [Acer negundo]
MSASLCHGILFLAPPPPLLLLLCNQHYCFGLNIPINHATGHRLTYYDFFFQTNSLAISLSKGDVAFILSPQSLQIPILYFSLLSLGVIISQANPDDSGSDITHLLNISRPVIVFATSQTYHKLIINPTSNYCTVLMDSPEFLSFLTLYDDDNSIINHRDGVVNQSDIAAILYLSGTSGPKKGVQLTHRNLIVVINATTGAEQYYNEQLVSLATRALAGVFGFTVMMRAVSHEETLVLLQTFELETILEAVDKYKANYMPVSPSEIVALLISDSTNKYDLSSLMFLGCGGAPLSEDVAVTFRDKFPNVEILRGYGLTETGALAVATKGPMEVSRLDSVGRLSEIMEAEIVDPITSEALFPGQEGELWLCGQNVMKVAPYKQIRRVAFINSIPRSHAGKILRRELVHRALSANFSTSS